MTRHFTPRSKDTDIHGSNVSDEDPHLDSFPP